MAAGRPRHHRQHGARIRRHDGLLPRRRANPRIPPPHRPRRKTQSRLVERYCKEQGLWRDDAAAHRLFTKVVELDLAHRRALPRRPQAPARPHRPLRHETAVAQGPHHRLRQSATPATARPKAAGKAKAATDRTPSRRHATPADADPGFSGVAVKWNGKTFDLKHGDVVIAAITSCTNTSNPDVMVAAGLLAKKAVEQGLTAQALGEDQPRPGSTRRHRLLRQSRPRSSYLESARLLHRRLRLHHLHRQLRPAARGNLRSRSTKNDLVVAAVLSGNRNFEGRINPDVKANYLASPPLVVAYALPAPPTSTSTSDPIGTGKNGSPVFLRDIWPTQQEVADTVARSA